MIFILNGDNVGEKMSEHVMSNDAEGLKASSDSISSAIKQIIDSIENMGGTILSNSGDEVIASLDNADSDTLNQIKQMFESSTGHTATIAVGETLDQTAKALVYAKMNQPGEIVQYDPSMDEELAGEQSQEDSLSEQDEQEQEGNENNQLEDSSQNDEQEASDEQSQDDLPMGNESDKKTVKIPVDEAVDEHEELVDVLNSPSQEDDKVEAEKQGQELDQYKEQQQDANQEDSDSDDQEGQLNDMIQQDMDSEDNVEQSGDSEDKNGEEDLGDVSSEDGSEQSDDDIPFLNEDDIAQDEQEGQEQDPSMQGQEQFEDSSMDEQNIDQEQEQSPEIQNLKNQIGQSLMVFKENKQIIDSIEQSNPDLYAALHAMISSMVDMGNMLIGSPDESQDSQDSSMDEQSAYSEDEGMNQEDQEAPEQEDGLEDSKKPLFGKSESGYRYSEKNPKIDIYHKGKYVHSTRWAKNLKQAKEKHLEQYKDHKPEDILTSFSDKKLGKSENDLNKTAESEWLVTLTDGEEHSIKAHNPRKAQLRAEILASNLNFKSGGDIKVKNVKNAAARTTSQKIPKPNLPKSEEGMAKSKEKGVNLNVASQDALNNRGESDAGRNTKASKKMNKLGQYNTANEQKQTAKRFASNVLSEIKDMPKPNLPKSEEGINVRNPNITVHDYVGKYNEKATKGRSGFGQKVRDAKSGKIDPQDAVDYGKGKLKEFQEQKKPNLPKSETDVVKAEKLKSFLKKNLKK